MVLLFCVELRVADVVAAAVEASRKEDEVGAEGAQRREDALGEGGSPLDAATAAKIAADNAQVAAQLEELRQHVLELQTNASRDKHNMATQLTEIGALNLKVVQSAKVNIACCCRILLLV